MPSKKTKEQVISQIEERNLRFPDKRISVIEDFEYIGTHQKIKVECENHHQWDATIKYIIKGHWCPICSRKEVGNNNVKDSSLFLLKLVDRNKKYSDKKVFIKDISEYKGMTKKMTWICEEGHEWKSAPKTIINIGTYCPECQKIDNVNRHTYSHKNVLSSIVDRNNKFPNKKVYLHLSEIYKHNKIKLLFVCDKGHTWKTKIGDVILKGSGCPICANSGFSYKAIDWMEFIERIEGISIQHIKNSEDEFRIPGTKYKVDGYCKETNTVYEFYGDYWHGNPETTVSTEINKTTKMSFEELYKKTLRRENNIKKAGYNVVAIWESEWEQLSVIKYEFQKIINKKCFDGEAIINSDIFGGNFPKVSLYHSGLKLAVNICPLEEWYEQNIKDKNINKKMIEESLSKSIRLLIFFEDEWKRNQQLILDKITYIAKKSNLQKVYARKCEIKQIPALLKASFLNGTHIQGDDGNCSVSYGAFYDNELVSVMTFVKPRVFMRGKKSIDGVYELSRFSSLNNLNVVGIASRLLTHFERDFLPKTIFSFADRRWSIGNLYHSIGFKVDIINNPEYFYVINGVRKHRWQFRKDVLKEKLAGYNSDLTEYQNMLNAGYDRVWGAGRIKYKKEVGVVI